MRQVRSLGRRLTHVLGSVRAGAADDLSWAGHQVGQGFGKLGSVGRAAADEYGSYMSSSAVAGGIWVGRHLPGVAAEVYRGAVAGAGAWAGQQHADLISGDPRRMAGAAIQAVLLASMIVPGPGELGEGTALALDGADHIAPEAYAGVRALSKQLIDMGATRAERLQIIQSFEVGTIKQLTAGASDYGLRFFGGRSGAVSRYLSDTFPAGDARALSALPPWNDMSQIAQFQIREGATYYAGRVASAFDQPGGGLQYFVPYLEDLSRV